VEIPKVVQGHGLQVVALHLSSDSSSALGYLNYIKRRLNPQTQRSRMLLSLMNCPWYFITGVNTRGGQSVPHVRGDKSCLVLKVPRCMIGIST
jgi:hypothetical protein